MKIQPVSPPDRSSHPLADLLRWYDGASIGDTVEVSGLPVEYAAASTFAIGDDMEAQGAHVIVKNANPRLRTPKSYLVTKVEFGRNFGTLLPD